jgi:hypothetical protein
VPQRRPSQRAGEGGEQPSRGCAHVQTPGCPEAEPEKLAAGAVATSHTMVETGLSALEAYGACERTFVLLIATAGLCLKPDRLEADNSDIYRICRATTRYGRAVGSKVGALTSL